MVTGKRRYWLPGMEGITYRDERYREGNIVNTVIILCGDSW